MNRRVGLIGIGVLLFAGCSMTDPSQNKLTVSPVCEQDETYYEMAGIAPEERMHFAKDRNTLIVGGVLDVSIVCHLSYILDQHPSISTLVISSIPRVADLQQTRKAAFFIRSKGLSTTLSRGGIAAGGGFDFFLGGRERYIADQESFSLVFALPDSQLAQLPMNHPDHLEHLDFYAKLGFSTGLYRDIIEKHGKNTHSLSLEELKQYNILSEKE